MPNCMTGIGFTRALPIGALGGQPDKHGYLVEAARVLLESVEWNMAQAMELRRQAGWAAPDEATLLDAMAEGHFTSAEYIRAAIEKLMEGQSC